MADEETALAPPPVAPGGQPTEEELAYRTPHAVPFQPQIYRTTEAEALKGYPEQQPDYVQRNDEVPSRPYVSPTGGEPTPISRELGGEPQPEPTPTPSTLPSWDDIVQTPTYQEADTKGRMEMLDNYVAQAKSYGHQLAAKNKEDPALYDAHLDKFYSREKAALETPYSIFDNTVRAGAQGAAEETAKMAAGGLGLAKEILQPELDLSYIKNFSPDEARHERELLSEQQPGIDRRSDEAQEYLKHPLAGLQDPSKQFEGGRAAALDAIQKKTTTDRTLSALAKYIETDGREVPRQTATEAAYAGVKQLPEMADKAIQVDDLYIREHPKLYNATKTIGSFVPWIAGQVLAAPLGPEAEIGINALMSYSDAFQTGYESAQAKIDQRVKAGEEISQNDREKMALDDASMTAFGVGSFNTVAASVFSSGMEGFHVPEEKVSFQTFKGKLKDFMLNPEKTIHPIAAEVGGQAVIQGGSQLAANVAAKASGVSPEQSATEGVPEAMLSGAEIGAGGTLMRGVASGFRWGMDNYKISQWGDRARTLSDQLFDTGHPDLTREKALDVAIANSVPANYQDAVRSRIALQESAKDQMQVSQELKETSPLTSAEVQKEAAATVNTDVSASTDRDARAQTLREQLAQAKAQKEAEKAAKEAAKKPPTEEAPPEAGAPTPPTPPTEEEGVPTHEETVKAGEEEAPTRISPDELNAKVDQLLGPNATAEAKRKLGFDYLNNFVYQDFKHDKGTATRKSTGNQLMRELGLIPELPVGKGWAGHTPGMLAELDNHFSQFLDQKIAEKAAQPPPTEPVAPVVEAPPAAEALPPVAMIPPEVFQDAVKTNDPAELLRQLKQGKQFTINQDQLEQYDDFLVQHKIEANFDKATGNYFLGVPAVEVPSVKELAVKPEGKPEAETDTVELSKNSPKLLEKIQALPPHPDEENLLKNAYAYLDREHDFIARQVNPKYSSVEDVTSATIASYLKDLREDPDHPPAISKHLAGVLGDYHEKVGADKRVELVSSTQPIAEGAAETIETQATAEEREKEAEPEAVAKGEVHPTFGLGYSDWQTIVKKIADTFDTSPEKRAAWQYFEKLLGKGNIDRPEEYGTATGIPKEVTAAVEKKIHEWLRKNLAELTPRGEAPAASVGEPGRPGAGAAGERPPPGEPAVPPPTHEGAVPRPTGEAGAGVRPTPPPPGGREPGVPPEGGAVAGRPPEPVPPAGKPEAGAVVPPAAAGGERAEPSGRVVPPEPAPGEPRATAIEIRERVEGKRAEPGEGGTAASTGGEPAGGVTYSPLDVAKAMILKPEVAAEHDIDLENFENDPQALADHLEELEGDQEDPDAWYRELYRDLGLKLPEEKPAALPPAAPTPKPETPAATALKARPGPKRTVMEDRTLELRIGKGAQTVAETLWKNKESPYWQDLSLDPKDFSTVNDLVVRVGDMFRGITKQQTFVQANKTILDFTSRIGETAALRPEERIATATGQEVAQKLFKHFSDNPENARKYMMEGIGSPEQIVTSLSNAFPEASPETINRMLQAMAQKEGLVEPPRPPGGPDSSGVMHSLAPGVTSATQKFTRIGDLISNLRMSSDPVMQAFAKSLNTYRDKVGNLNVRQLNNVTPAIFYHDGELWVSPAALEHEHGTMALAHEVQHSIAQEKITNPKSPQDFEAAAHWEALRDELRKNLPPELRDSLEGHLAKVFNEYDGLQELNTRTLSHDEKNWLPVLYAAHSPENMLHAAFSNRMFRDHLASIRYPRGETLLNKVHDWGRTIFGEQAFKYADEAHPLVSERPGIPAQFNPKVFDLRDSYPLTESEHQVRRTVAKYQLHQGLDTALRQVEAISDDPRHKAIAQMLREIVAKYPEIKIGLENRLGGISGGYDFQEDRVTVNPHMDDHSIESTILHETVHALTMAKIDAFEKGQVHLLSAEDAHAVAELEELRKAALADRRVPQVIRDIADLPTYEQREKALLDLFQRRPEMQKWYGLTDTREFASETLTNGGLQDHLNRVPFAAEGERPKTMLQKMFSWVRKFLGFKDNTILSQAFDNVATLAGGRRVMEAQVETGGLESEPTMTMKENLLAKRYLDHRAETEGFRGGTREVPLAQLNDWLREYRDQKGFSSRGDPYSPRTVAQPETRSQFKPTTELAGLTDGRDIVDHLARVSDTARDPDSLSMMTDRALRDKAITVDQYIRAQAAASGAGYHSLQKLHVSLGSEEDQTSLASRFGRAWKNLLLPQGTLPKPIHEAILKHEKYAQAETAYKIRNLKDNLTSAIKKAYKTSDITPKMREDFNKILRGDRTSARTMPAEVLNALDDMRAHVDSGSLYIYSHNMASIDQEAAIEANFGKYLTRNYRMFEDPRYGSREISKVNRPQAETELNNFLKQKEFNRLRGDLVNDRAHANALDAASVFAPGSIENETTYRRTLAAEKARLRNNPATLWLDKTMAKFNQIAENRQTKDMQYGHAFTVKDELLEELSPFMNASPALRKMMGEETNPAAMYARTVWRQSAFIHSVELGREIAAMGRKAGYIRNDFTPATPAQIPSQFVHLGELAGKWTTKDIASALTNYVETLRQSEHGIMASSLRALESNARYLTTIGSAQRGFGNIWSGIFAHLNNGYLNPFDREAWGAATKVFQGNLLRMTTPELEDYISKMHRYGLSDKTGNVGLIMDFLRSGPHIMERDPQDIGEEISQFLTKRVKQAPGLARTGEFMIDFHTLGNFMSKASQWEKEKVRQRAIDDWWVKNRPGRLPLSNEQIESKAAELVRDTNISYSLATKTIQQMRKNPTVGTFLTFWSEALRSYSNSVMQAFRHLRSENPVEQSIGRSRLAGLMASLAIPGALMGASKAMFNVSNKEDDNFRSLLPPWERHNAIFYGPVINGRRTYTTINYVTPQGDVHRAINALLAPNQQGIVGKMRDAVGEVFAPVFNVGLVPGALIDVYRNQTAYGTQVYNQNDHWWNQVGDMSQYVFHREFGGSGGRFMSKIVPALTTPGGKVTPGGAVYDWDSSILPELSGLQVKEISYPDRFRSELYSSKNSIEHAQSLFTGPIQRSGNEMTDDQIRNAYQRSEDARRNAFENLHQQIQAARFGGMTSREIKTALKARRYSDQVIDDLMTGRYRPYVPGAGILKNARANGNFISPRLFGRHATPIEEEE